MLNLSAEQRAVHLCQYEVCDRIKIMRSSFTEKEGWEAMEWMTPEEKQATLKVRYTNGSKSFAYIPSYSGDDGDGKNACQ